jgi:hypothetical protein
MVIVWSVHSRAVWRLLLVEEKMQLCSALQMLGTIYNLDLLSLMLGKKYIY